MSTLACLYVSCQTTIYLLTFLWVFTERSTGLNEQHRVSHTHLHTGPSRMQSSLPSPLSEICVNLRHLRTSILTPIPLHRFLISRSSPTHPLHPMLSAAATLLNLLILRLSAKSASSVVEFLFSNTTPKARADISRRGLNIDGSIRHICSARIGEHAVVHGKLNIQ